jgi:hypothetical protein
MSEPGIQLAKTVSPSLHLDAQIATYERQHNVPREATAYSPGQRKARGSKALCL